MRRGRHEQRLVGGGRLREQEQPGGWRGEHTVKGVGREDVGVPVLGRLIWPPSGKGQGQTGRGKTRAGKKEVLGLEAGLRQGEKKKAGVRGDTEQSSNR